MECLGGCSLNRFPRALDSRYEFVCSFLGQVSTGEAAFLAGSLSKARPAISSSSYSIYFADLIRNSLRLQGLFTSMSIWGRLPNLRLSCMQRHRYLCLSPWTFRASGLNLLMYFLFVSPSRCRIAKCFLRLRLYSGYSAVGLE